MVFPLHIIVAMVNEDLDSWILEDVKCLLIKTFFEQSDVEIIGVLVVFDELIWKVQIFYYHVRLVTFLVEKLLFNFLCVLVHIR